jgi:hypothetical protein
VWPDKERHDGFRTASRKQRLRMSRGSRTPSCSRSFRDGWPDPTQPQGSQLFCGVSRRHVLIGCALAPFAARAAPYPDRPIRVIIPIRPAGSPKPSCGFWQ